MADMGRSGKAFAVAACVLAALAGGVAMAVAASGSTSTNVACATATLPAHTIADNGTPAYTITGTSTAACNTVTYTIPTVTQTVTQASGGATWNGTQETGSASTACTKYASPSGSDSSGTGAISSPWATVQKLSDSLTTGQVGCLRAGSYANSSTQTIFRTPNVTITAYPGEAATIHGFPLVSAAATLNYLNFVPDKPGYTLEVEASSATIEHNNVSEAPVPGSSRGNGIGVGWNTTATAGISGVTIAYNRIHDFGLTPPGSPPPLDHGIYVANANHSNFYDNWIYNGPYGAGIQFYDGNSGEAGPHDDHAYANVIDATYLGLYIWGEVSGFQNVIVDHNVISNTTPSSGFEASGSTDSTNTFTTNDGYNITGSWPCSSCGNVTTSGNIGQNPQYQTPNTGSNTPDFRTGNTALGGWGLWNGDQ